jgi:hypothetical protein
MTKPKGYVLHHGISPINGEPYVAIITITSANRKTGNMAQVWILCEHTDPVVAVRDGSDESICGDCPHRKQADGTRTCYVNVGQAPLSVWKGYKRGIYPELDNVERLKGLSIRWGAYGDPGILPYSVVSAVNAVSTHHTGYKRCGIWSHHNGVTWAVLNDLVKQGRISKTTEGTITTYH